MSNLQAAVSALFCLGVAQVFYLLFLAWRALFNPIFDDFEKRRQALVQMFRAAVSSAALFVGVLISAHERWTTDLTTASAIFFAFIAGMPILYISVLYCRGFFEDSIRKLRQAIWK